MLNTTVNTGLIIKTIRVSNTLLSETRVRMNKEGIAIRAVNASNICLTDVFIPKKDFEVFNAEEGVIGINVKRLNDVLKVVEKTAWSKDSIKVVRKYGISGNGRNRRRVAIEEAEKMRDRTSRAIVLEF